MKWKAKRVPTAGETRWTIRFALFPHRCNDGYMRWLCDLYVRQRYDEYEDASTWIDLEYSAELPHPLGVSGYTSGGEK